MTKFRLSDITQKLGEITAMSDPPGDSGALSESPFPGGWSNTINGVNSFLDNMLGTFERIDKIIGTLKPLYEFQNLQADNRLVIPGARSSSYVLKDDGVDSKEGSNMSGVNMEQIGVTIIELLNYIIESEGDISLSKLKQLIESGEILKYVAKIANI